MQRSQWWNWDDERLQEVEKMFEDIDGFIARYDCQVKGHSLQIIGKNLCSSTPLGSRAASLEDGIKDVYSLEVRGCFAFINDNYRQFNCQLISI